MKKIILNTVFILSAILLLGGCTRINKIFNNGEGSDGYKKAGSVSSLEVPPDLTEPQYDSTFAVSSVNSGTVSANSRGKDRMLSGNRANVQVLPESSAIHIKGSGRVRWLEVAAPANTLWSKVQGFWKTVGADLKRNEPTVGIMETDWIQTRGKLPQSAFQRALGGILKNATDSGIRDRYTTRFEKASANLTRIYISHRGAELMVTDTGNKWEMRPSRSAAEGEMLNRLKAYLQGVDPKKIATESSTSSSAESSGLATLIVDKKGSPKLKIQDSFQRAWVRTGSALTSAGFTLEGQDVAKRLYTTVWVQEEGAKKGFFRRLISSRDRFLADGSQQLIQVNQLGNDAVLTVLDANKKPLDPKQATKILERLKTELNR